MSKSGSSAKVADKQRKPLPPPRPLVDEAGVRRFLSRHPDFFHDNQYLLTNLKIPHPVRPAVSLIERQVEMLREQNAQLQQQALQQIAIARDNERLNDRMRELCLSLFAASSITDRLEILRSHLLEDLAATAVSLRFFCTPESMAEHGLDTKLHADVSNSAFRKLFANYLNNPKPLCGRLSKGQRTYLFQQDAELIKSAVVVPLSAYQHKSEPIGLLAIGSDSVDRFQPDMGTTFLDHLGELVGQALGICLDQNPE